MTSVRLKRDLLDGTLDVPLTTLPADEAPKRTTLTLASRN
jgi:hypothetical protein